jgi:hypothetical protein
MTAPHGLEAGRRATATADKTGIKLRPAARVQSRSGRKDFLPVEAQGDPLLPLSPKRTQVGLISLLYLVLLPPDPLRTVIRRGTPDFACW